MTSYSSVRVKCPFYVDDTPLRISCEGAFCHARTVSRFRNSEARQAVKERYCDCDYRGCRIYWMLSDRYDDDGRLIED